MKKISMIAVLTTVLTLFGSGLSYAAPPQAEPLVAADTSQVALTQAIAELKTAGIPHETVYDTDGVKTTFHFEQGLSFTLVEPAAAPSVSAFLGGGWRWGQGPYITLSPRDQDLIIRGAEVLLIGAVCKIPGVGWATCGIAGVLINEAANHLKGRKICGNRDLEIATQGPFSVRARCK